MIEINSVSLGKLRKEQHLGLMTNTDRLIGSDNVVKTGITPLYASFNEALAIETAAVKLEQGSLTTGKMDDMDTEREDLITGFDHLIENGLRHFDTAKRDAATQLKHVVDKYGSFRRKTNADETVDIRSMCAELLSEQNSTALGTLPDGVEWVTRIQTSNEGYNALYIARNAENNGQKIITSGQAREQTDPCYNAIVRRLNALAELNGDAAYAGFINQLNGLIADLKSTMSAQATARRKTNEKADTSSDTAK